MIRVVKPSTPSAGWLLTAEAHRQTHCDEFEAAPDEYRSGTRTFTFSDVYKADEIKDALRTAQHAKCAFCESLFTHIAYGDIEHFRPKAGYRLHRGEKPLRRPGYYWLAYDWSNLFYSCQLCNQEFKENLFPLRDNRSRARSHRWNVANEQPLLIDPAAQDPASFISFRGEYAFAVNNCREGETTIEALGLNRAELVEARRDRLARLEELVLLRDLLREKAATAPDPAYARQLRSVEATLQDSRNDQGQYAAMARAFLTP